MKNLKNYTVENLKNLKNYKIETKSLNEAILHKAKELGYNDEIESKDFLFYPFLYFYSNGHVFYGSTRSFFAGEPNNSIHPHDFLRLNWEPKVGERIKRISPGYGNVYNGEEYIIDTVDKRKGRLNVKEIYNWSFQIDKFIPIYPKKDQSEKPEKQLRFKTKQEFIDEFGDEYDWRCNAFVEDDVVWPGTMDYLLGTPHDGSEVKDGWFIYNEMLTDKPLPEEKPQDEGLLRGGLIGKPEDQKPDAYINRMVASYIELVAWDGIKSYTIMCPPKTLADNYNLLSESEYKAKYPNKMAFKEWEVTLNQDNLKIGCVKIDIEAVRLIHNAIYKSESTPEDLMKVSMYDFYNFLCDHKEELEL